MAKLEFSTEDFDRAYLLNAFSSMPGGLFIYQANEDGKLLYANEAVLRVFECDSAEEFLEITGGTFGGMVYSKDRATVDSAIWEQVRAHEDRFDHISFRIQTKSGKIKYLEDYGRMIEDEKLGPLFYVFLVEGKAKYLAYEQDDLTGFPGMRRFLQYSENVLELVRRDPENVHYAYVYFNFTNLKRFNAVHGFDAGDAVLKKMALALSRVFPNNFISRFSEDHFVVCTDAQDLETRISTVRKEVEADTENLMQLKAGIYNVTPTDVSAAVDCDLAKYACDFIKEEPHRFFCVYKPGLEKDNEKTAYIVENLDRAISEGWIEPFYQPVIRTLSGEICSAEALARWRDPERGLISPADFIPILEKKGLSYKLDLCIVERVVGMLQQRILAKEAVIPISVNISRSDFDFCDPVEIIANACDSHYVRRDLICIEITETALLSDMGILRTAVDRFHKEGFEVWMDDFGSGYSSLNVLKDFEFDEIKIDMGFLRNFNERSRKIVTAAVRMAKELGVHTLAEGVETKEHVEFLKSIGCERIQGYYYGKPLPVTESVEHLKGIGILAESHERSKLFQKIGLIDIINSQPYAILMLQNDTFRILYGNEKFLEEMRPLGASDTSDVEVALSRVGTLRQTFLDLSNKVMVNNQAEVSTFILNNRFYHVTLNPIACNQNEYAFSLLLDRTVYEEQLECSLLDKVIRNIVLAYDCIYIFDYKADTRTVYRSVFPSEHNGDVLHGIDEHYKHYRNHVIHPADLNRFKKMMNLESILRRLRESNRGNFSELISIKFPQGSYFWAEFLFLAIPDSDRQFLVCIKPAIVENVERLLSSPDPDSIEDSHEHSQAWHRSLLNQSNLKLFWKDKNRRFLGATRAFLDYYGFESLDDIRGKTDEEIGWHVEEVTFATDERKVIEKGVRLCDIPGRIIVNGIIRPIVVNKFPVYRNGKIIGLIGYFVDAISDLRPSDEKALQRLCDPVTGLMNSHGMIISMMELDDNYRTQGEDYLNVQLAVHGYKELLVRAGKEVADQLLIMIADLLKKFFGKKAIIARTVGSYFSIAIRNVEAKSMLFAIRDCVKEIEVISDVAGNPCQLQVMYGGANGKEGDSMQSVMEMALRRQKLMQRKTSKSEELDDLFVDPFFDIPLSYFVVKPVLDHLNGQALDMKFLFVNQMFCRLTGMPRHDLLGFNYLDLFPKTDKSWVNVAYRAASGEVVRAKLYDGATHHWLRFTAIQATIPGTCAFIAEIDDSED